MVKLQQRKRTSKVLRVGLALSLLLVSFIASIPLALLISDPMTLHPVRSGYPGMPFPVVVLNAGVPRIAFLPENLVAPPLGPGESYLVPTGAEHAVEAALRIADSPNWVLRVAARPGGTQRIDLFILNDGYRGGIYEASAFGVRPIHRRHTGPGYALDVMAIALGLAGLLSTLLLLGVWWWRRFRRTGVPS